MSNDQNAVVVRNLSVVLIVLVIIGILAIIVARIIGGGVQETPDRDATVTERAAPVGNVSLDEPLVSEDSAPAVPNATAEATAAAAAGIGKVAYGKICFACHDAGVAGAPKLGDTDGWSDRLDKGTEMLVSNAITGFTGEVSMMPPKGGMASLSDDEVRAAVLYMLAENGAGDPVASDPPAAQEEQTPATEPVAEAAAHSTTGNSRGKEVYDAACFVCHATGVAGAPKLGDTAGWTPRVAKGADTLYRNAIKGFMGEAGLMPPKGGRMDFSDDDVKAAVDYMVNAGP